MGFNTDFENNSAARRIRNAERRGDGVAKSVGVSDGFLKLLAIEPSGLDEITPRSNRLSSEQSDRYMGGSAESRFEYLQRRWRSRTVTHETV